MTNIYRKLLEWPRFQRLVTEWDINPLVEVDGIWTGFRPFMLAALWHSMRRNIICVTGQIDEAERLYDEIRTLAGPNVLLFPAWDFCNHLWNCQNYPQQ